MRHRVLAANVEDDRQTRLEVDDVREVLLGPDAEINASWRQRALQRGNHVLICFLVRDEVFGREGAAVLGHRREDAPELPVGERLAERLTLLRGGNVR